MQRGLVIRDTINDGNASDLLVGKTLYNEYGSGASVGKVGSVDMALAHFTNEAQINTLSGADDGTGTGWIVEGVFGDTINKGQLIAMGYFSNPFFFWYPLTNTDSPYSTLQLGIAMNSGGYGDVIQVLIKGFYTTKESTYYQNPSSKGAGVPLYIGSSSGTVTSDAPTASGSYVRIIGDVWRSQQGSGAGGSTVIYFNPQNVFSFIE